MDEKTDDQVSGVAFDESRPHVVRALMLAEQHHSGQFDKSGEPYILHVARVGLSLPDDDSRVVGFLHDILEDTDVTEDDLRVKYGFYDSIVDAVVCLTHQPDELYMDFIYRCNVNWLARLVKIADIRDNLRPGITESLLDRYLKALQVLL